MKVTLIGHATLFVEMDGLRCLMDPVLQDPFEEGAVVSCPKREVLLDKLPPVDLLVISHRHPDHFDIPSLARLSRNCQVMCPRDHVIAYALKELGFARVHQVDSMEVREFSTYELAVTRSENRDCAEFGVIFKDKSGTFWNQVDSIPSQQTIQMNRERYGTLDLHFAMYASQNLGFFQDRSTGFPHKVYEYNLGNVLQARPRMVVPGSGGFRFSDEHDWCNRFLFPVSREQFLEDLRRLDPSIQSCIANPGDEFVIDKGQVRHKSGASPFARMVEEDTHRIRFDPTGPIPPLLDRNPHGYPADRLTRTADEVRAGIAAYLRAGYASNEPVVVEHRTHRVRYLLCVVFPDGTVLRARFIFGEHEASFESEAPENAQADTVHWITASALAAWSAYENSYFYLRAYSRMFTTLHTLSREGERAVVEPRPLTDLLMHYLQRIAKGADMALKHQLDRELARYRERPA